MVVSSSTKSLKVRPAFSFHCLRCSPELGYPIPGKTTVYDKTATIDLDSVALNGGLLVRTLVFSIDPSIRGRMRVCSSLSNPVLPKRADANRRHILLGNREQHNNQRDSNSCHAWVLGCLTSASGAFYVPMIPTSKWARSWKGSLVRPALLSLSMFLITPDFEEYTVVKNTPDRRLRVIHNEVGLPLSLYVGIAGMPGKTAYYGWKGHSQAKKVNNFNTLNEPLMFISRDRVRLLS